MTTPLPSDLAVRPVARRCAREGCLRRKQADGYCCALCREIDDTLTGTRSLIAEKGISPEAAALWAAAVSLSDQLSEVFRLESSLSGVEVTGARSVAGR